MWQRYPKALSSGRNLAPERVSELALTGAGGHFGVVHALLAALAGFILPQISTAGVCIDAIDRVAATSPVPREILYSVALVESGHTVGAVYLPWPWTINEAGNASRFESGALAVAHVRDRISAGVRNIDIGCLQINYHWHGQEFASIDEMFDPLRNVSYGARYLETLYRQNGDWEMAIGAYHSGQPDRAARYAEKVMAFAREGPVSSETNPNPYAPDQRRPLLVGAAPLLVSPGRRLVDLGHRSPPLFPALVLSR
jgi:soluble lytic murein transglycosylase-like protein